MQTSDAPRPVHSAPTPEHDDDLPTQASIFREMKEPCPKKRQIAWGAFYRRYARIIAGFARNMGARPDEIDNIIQEVMLGFFKALDKFEYDPSKGRFRGFLKVCTFRVLQEHLRARGRFQGMQDQTSLDRLESPDAQPRNRRYAGRGERQSLPGANGNARPRNYRAARRLRGRLRQDRGRLAD